MSNSHEASVGPNVARGLAEIRRRIADAVTLTGRKLSDVSLVAVSKFHPITAVEAALAEGQMIFGENRVQEACEKFTPALREKWPDARLHLIGSLQTNKALQAVQVADVIESLDRQALLDAISRAVDKTGRTPDLLVQVNTGREVQKAGVMPEAADDFISLCRSRFGSSVRGVMCIPPENDDPEPHFRSLAALARAHDLDVISMGMSSDFEVAIACGATHVRVGTAIFGSRP